MPEFNTTGEDLFAKILQGLSDRIAGRQFSNASPAFFGTPDAPDAFFAEDPSLMEPLEGADLEGGEVGHDHGHGGEVELNHTGSLAWGGHANGHIPAEQMEDIGGGHRLETNAAGAWKKMVAAAAKDGIDIGLTDSYRSYAGQVDVRRRKGHMVATAKPGTSNHGWGRAVDANVNDPKTLAWLRQNAARFGWVNPPWAQRAGKSYEPWHWEYRAKPVEQVPAGKQTGTGAAPQMPALEFQRPVEGAF